MELTPLPDFGSVLVGGLLSDLSAPEFEKLRGVVEDVGLVVARGQFLTREAHVALALRFGPIDEYDTRVPNTSSTPYVPRRPGSRVVAEGTDSARPAPAKEHAGEVPRWRLDGSFKSNPVCFSTEAAIDIGPEEWTTVFANLQWAFGRLESGEQIEAERVQVWHSAVYAKAQAGEIEVPLPDDVYQLPGASHPLVFVHPSTRRRGLYVGENAVAVAGQDLESGRALLDQYVSLVSHRGNLAVHRWEQGDVVIWDSRFVAHRRRPPVGTSTATIRHISIVDGGED